MAIPFLPIKKNIPSQWAILNSIELEKKEDSDYSSSNNDIIWKSSNNPNHIENILAISVAEEDIHILILYNDKIILNLPKKFKSLANEIEFSKYLLNFQENWDDQNSKAYLLETWEKTIKFIGNYSIWLYENYYQIITPPKLRTAQKEV